jgi:hypothetical protein
MVRRCSPECGVAPKPGESVLVSTTAAHTTPLVTDYQPASRVVAGHLCSELRRLGLISASHSE